MNHSSLSSISLLNMLNLNTIPWKIMDMLQGLHSSLLLVVLHHSGNESLCLQDYDGKRGRSKCMIWI
jgi:hypothetical protein